MRKYRGLTKDGNWAYGYFFKSWKATYILSGTKNDIPNMTEVLPETVDQSTGLEKNGKDLDWWEGDLFEIHGRSTLFRIIDENGCFWLESSITKERFPCHRVITWAELPEKLGDSQTITNP
jgi:hypothetical protein